MSVGIYGDSYACISPDPDLRPHRWVEQLSDTVLYAASGSSAWWSYENFIRSHDQHDRVVWVVTEPGRYDIGARAQHLGKPVDRYSSVTEHHVSGIGHLRNLQRRGAVTKRLAQQITGVFAIAQPDRTQRECELLVESARRIRPDLLLIAGFPIHPAPEGLSLWDVYRLDHRVRSVDRYLNQQDVRPCHMNYRNNVLLAQRVDTALDRGLCGWLDLGTADQWYSAGTPEDLWSTECG